MGDDERAFEAVRQGDVDALRALIAADPDVVRARDTTGVSILQVALSHGRREALDVLLECAPELDVFEAAALGRTDRLDVLLESDASLRDAWSPDGFTPLMLAAFFGRPASVDCLLTHGAATDVAARNPLGVHPINAAAAGGNLEALNLLLAHGADVDARMTAGHAPLHAAAANGRDEMVEALLAHGAAPAPRNDEGRTPAHLASDRGHVAIAARLEHRDRHRPGTGPRRSGNAEA